MKMLNQTDYQDIETALRADCSMLRARLAEKGTIIAEPTATTDLLSAIGGLLVQRTEAEALLGDAPSPSPFLAYETPPAAPPADPNAGDIARLSGEVTRLSSELLVSQSNFTTMSRRVSALNEQLSALTIERSAANQQAELLREELAAEKESRDRKVTSDLLKFGIRGQSITLPKPSGEMQAAPNLTDLARMIKAASGQQI